jgi:hypothetical protein
VRIVPEALLGADFAAWVASSWRGIDDEGMVTG